MATPILRANKLVKSVPTAEGLLTILDGVDVEINSGEAVAILGQSGSGKTTLLGLLAGLDLPTSGTVHLDGEEITAKRLGIDYDTLSKTNPGLIYASISGFGQDGPLADRPGFDQIAQGMGGLMSITGQPGQGPMRVGIPIADLCAAQRR